MPHKDKETTNAYYRRLYAEGRTWGQRNKHIVARKRRRRTLRQYGLSPLQWDAMFDSQGRACAICRRLDPNGPSWATDHDHATRKTRAILCSKCNLALGHMQDSPALLRAAAEYLDAHKNGPQ